MYHDQLLGPDGIEPYDYLTETRGLSRATLEHFQLGAVLEPADEDSRMTDRISIGYRTPTGYIQIKFRATPWMETKSKYMNSPGSQTTMFNTPALLESDRWIAICEGEFDVMAAWMAGVPAVGIPGVDNWKGQFSTLLEGYERIYILADNDPSKVDDSGKEQGQQGLRFAETLCEVLPNAAIVLMPETGDDVNGPNALRALLKLEKL